ncbi:MAG: hypothetical protein AMJ62_09625 [Myxococcales bacterium SG8_38]|nr:MAG: hypothetical protein AMJ62_09625 [Myxococcales bacterium SG8_38]
MRDCRKLELALALVASLSAQLFFAAAVHAQGFREDRAGTEGPGFKTGRLVLHPGLSLEGGYDSNVFLQDQNAEDSFLLRLTGYLDVATEGSIRQAEGDTQRAAPQKIEFRGGLGVAYYHFFIDRIADNAAADAHIDFSYNPSQVFSLQVRNLFRRTVRPFSDPNTVEGRTIGYGSNNNTASLDLVGRSKSQVLEGRVGYTNQFAFFDADIYQYGNTMTHRVPASFSWSFFPTSALVWDLGFSAQRFDADRLATSPTLLSDNERIASAIGYNGALTERFSLSAFVGYAVGFYDLGDDFDGVTARVEARWRPRPTVTLTGGYDRDYVPSFIGNFTLMNRLYLETRFIVSGALELGVKAWVSFDKSGLAVTPDGVLLDSNQPYREDIRLFTAFFAEYRFKAWLALFGELGYLADFTDFEYSGVEPLVEPTASYQKFQAWVGLRVFY